MGTETLSISLVGSIDDDTTLHFDVRERDTDRRLGSASLKLKEVVNNEGYGVFAKRTLHLTRRSGWSHGDVVVEVLIEEPGTAQPGEQPPEKTKKLGKATARVVAVGVVSGIVDAFMDAAVDI